MKCEICGEDILPGQYVIPFSFPNGVRHVDWESDGENYFKAVMGSDGLLRWLEVESMRNELVCEVYIKWGRWDDR